MARLLHLVRAYRIYSIIIHKPNRLIPTNVYISHRNCHGSLSSKNNGIHTSKDWNTLYEYACKSNLLQLSHSDINNWLKISCNDNIDPQSIHIRDVNSCGQKYILYDEYINNDLYQNIIVRGTKNWKNIKTSLQYQIKYNTEFEMKLHSGYGIASHKVLQDLKQYIKPNAKLNFTGHSYGGVVCCCIASVLHRNSAMDINQIVVFGMPQFTTSNDMVSVCDHLPLTRVQHINDEIAKFDWNKLIIKQRFQSKKRIDKENGYQQYPNSNCEMENDGLIYVGSLDHSKSKFVHRMGDYVKSIENHKNVSVI